MGERSGRVGAPARLAHTVRTRKAQATEKLATVKLEKLLDMSGRIGNAAPVERDAVEIVREAQSKPAKFADASGVGAAAESINELAVPVEVEDDDLAIPIESEAPIAAIAPAPAVDAPAPAVDAAEPKRSRRLWWLTLLVALIASGVIAARLLGL